MTSSTASKKILILGANGMLGHDLVEVFRDNEVMALDKDELDITNQNDVLQKIKDLKPEIVLNAAAYTDVDGAEDNEELATDINGRAVGYIAEACNKVKATLVHFSTEMVFSGDDEVSYDEQAETNPKSAYGRSKFVGEQALVDSGVDYYLIRSQWLYGKAPQAGKPRGMNFVETMLKLASEKEELTVVDDQFGRPTFTKDLAQASKELVFSGKPSGVYHLVNETPEEGVSWYDFAKKIFEISNVGIKISPVSSDQYPQKAKRPTHAVLLNTKFDKLRIWEEALEDYINSKP